MALLAQAVESEMMRRGELASAVDDNASPAHAGGLEAIAEEGPVPIHCGTGHDTAEA